jgi:hypothetical protein
MYLFPTDESGNTGWNLDSPDQPLHFLLTIGIHEDKSRDIERELFRIALDYFPREARNSDFEFHGGYIYRGEGYFNALAPADRLQIYNRLIQVIVDFELPVFVEGIDKRRLKASSANPAHPYNLAFLYMVERLEEFLESQQPPANGLICADENRERDRSIISDFDLFKEYGTALGYKPREIKRLLDTVHFVKSQDSRLIQIADCSSYLICRYHNLNMKPPANITVSDKEIIRLHKLLESTKGGILKRISP